MTIELHESIDLDVPAAVAWRIVADYGRDPEWRTAVSAMGAGVVEPGTTTMEVMRLGGRTYRNGGEVLAVDPGHRFTWRTTSGTDADGSRTVEALGPGRCRVTLELRIRLHGVERLLTPAFRPMARRTLAGDAARLRELASALAEVGLG